MPVEPVGLVLAIASLFTTCLDLLDIISNTRAYSAAYLDLVCVLEVERLLLVRWGEAVGLLHRPNINPAIAQPYSKQLEDEEILPIVAEILSRLKRKFEDANALVAKYTPRQPADKDLYHPDSNPHSIFKVVHARQGRMLERMQSETSLVMKTLWAISGRAKSLDLMNEITKLNRYLRRLVPIAGSVEAKHHVQSVPGECVVLSRVPNHSLALNVANAHHDTRGELGHIENRYSYREHMSAEASGHIDSPDGAIDPTGLKETQSISAILRARGDLSTHSSGHDSIKRSRQDWMVSLFFILFVYVGIPFAIIISFVIAIMRILLSFLFSLVCDFIMRERSG